MGERINEDHALERLEQFVRSKEGPGEKGHGDDDEAVELRHVLVQFRSSGRVARLYALPTRSFTA